MKPPELPPGYEIEHVDEGETSGWHVRVRGDWHDGVAPISTRERAVSFCWRKFLGMECSPEWRAFFAQARETAQ